MSFNSTDSFRPHDPSSLTTIWNFFLSNPEVGFGLLFFAAIFAAFFLVKMGCFRGSQRVHDRSSQEEMSRAPSLTMANV